MNSLRNIISGQEIFCHSVVTRYLLKNSFYPTYNLPLPVLLSPVTVTIILLYALLLLAPSVHAIQPAFIKGRIFNTYNNSQLNNATVSTRNGISAATASGAFALRVPPNIYTLLANAPASSANLITGVPAAPGKIPCIKLYISPASTPIGYVEGRIVNAGSGDGIPGALIMTTTGGAAISTGRDGSYRLASPSGTATISITADGFSSRQITLYTIYPYITTNINISLEEAPSRTLSVKGVITDACTGLRIDEAVIISNAGKITTSSDGFFSIDTPLGLSTLVVSALISDDIYDCNSVSFNYQYSSRTFFLTPLANTVQNFNLIPSRSITGLISGTITDSLSGAVIAGVKVESDLNQISYSRQDGTYTLYASACTTSLSFARSGYEPTAIPIIFLPDNTVVKDIALPPLGVIAGVVRDSHTNTGIRDAQITLAEDQTVSCKSSQDGSFVLRGIRTGIYTLEVSHPCYLPESRAAIPVSAGNTTAEQFMLNSSERATVHGTVRVFFTRRPIPSALIASSTGASVTTGIDGSYSIELPACTTHITIRAPGFLPATKRNVSPAEGETSELNVRLLPWPFRFPADREQSHIQ